MTRHAAVIAAILTIVGAGTAACGHPHAAAPPTSASCQSRDVATRVATIESFKHSTATPPGGVSVVNAGDFVYQSVPQQVAAPGRYTLRFGPLRPDFDYPRDPSGIAFDFPCDFPGKFRPAGAIATVRDADNRRWAQVTFDVTGQFSPAAPIVLIY